VIGWAWTVAFLEKASADGYNEWKGAV